MIDVKLLRDTPNEVRDSLKSRGYDLNIAYFEELDEMDQDQQAVLCSLP